MIRAFTIGSPICGISARARRRLARGDLQHFGFLRFHPRARQRRGSLQHRHIAEKIARVRSGENLFDAIARLEDFEFSLQRDREREFALTRFENEIAATKRAALPQRLQQRELLVAQFRKSDALGIAIKLLVLLC